MQAFVVGEPFVECDRLKRGGARKGSQVCVAPDMVSVELLEKVRKLLVEKDVRHWVDHHAISVDGRPAVTVINLDRRADPRRVQDLLDAAA
jgi:hypothetical protein